jgi:hypothetical protein
VGFATKNTNIPVTIHLWNLGLITNLMTSVLILFNSAEWLTWTSRIRIQCPKPLSLAALTLVVAMSFMLMKPSQKAMASVVVADLVTVLVADLVLVADSVPVAGMVAVADLVTDLGAGMVAADSADDVVVGMVAVDVVAAAVALVTGRVLALLVQVGFILYLLRSLHFGLSKHWAALPYLLAMTCNFLTAKAALSSLHTHPLICTGKKTTFGDD